MSTPAGIAAGITGIISFLGSGIPTLENLLQLGTLQLMNMVDFMTDNPQYDMVEFNIPWLSYVSVNNEALRFFKQHQWQDGLSLLHILQMDGRSLNNR